MPVARHIQTSLNAGEFDPQLWSREDVTFFYNSARLIENVIPLPQGGSIRRDGLISRAPQRGAISAIPTAGAAVTAANGGTSSQAHDDDENTVFLTTGGIGTATAYEIIAVDFGSATAVAMVDFLALEFVGLPVAITEGNLSLQHSSDAISWATAATLAVGEAAYNRRFASSPDEPLGTARHWRLIVDNPTGADFSTAEVQFSEMDFWAEAGRSSSGASVGAFSAHRLTSSISDEYILIATAGNIDVFTAAGAWVAAQAIPHTESQVAAIKNAPNLDTMILYHEEQPPHLVQRLGSDIDWRSEPVTFESVALFEFEDATTGGENEIQLLTFGSMAVGDIVVAEFNGEISAEVTWTANEATNAAALEAAIEGLEDISSVSVAAYNSTTGVDATLSVEFDGDDGNLPWATLIISILFDTGGGTVTNERKQYGKRHQEALWDAERGYPRCGAFYQGRHYMAGFAARPDVIAASRAGSLFDFKADADPVAGSPIVVAPNVDDQITILNLYPGRHLQIFASSAELYIPDEPVTPDNIALKVTGRHGSSPDVQPVDIQGGTLFVDRNGTSVREYLFTDAEASYTAEPVSLLAGHLVSSPQSFVLRRAQNEREPTLLFLANTGQDAEGADVPAALTVIDRAQQVTGFARITSSGGVFKGFATTQAGQTFAVTYRELEGNAWNYIEQFDGGYMSDASIKIANPDIDDFTASAGQTSFTWTFTSPASEDDVAVWSRSSSSAAWVRESDADYTVALGSKAITFASGKAAGTLVRINRRADSIDISAAAPHLDGIEVYCHSDGLPLGSFTSSSGVIDLGDARLDFEAEVGLFMVPRIVLHPYKGKGEVSPTMQRMRIFRCLLNMIRTGGVAITAHDGGTARPVDLQNYDSGNMDPVLEEVLYSGTRRVSGIGKWQIEPVIEITQITPMPFQIRSATYDVRY